LKLKMRISSKKVYTNKRFVQIKKENSLLVNSDPDPTHRLDNPQLLNKLSKIIEWNPVSDLPAMHWKNFNN